MNDLDAIRYGAKDYSKAAFDVLHSHMVKRHPYFRKFSVCGVASEVSRRATVSREGKWIYFRIGKAANSTIFSTIHFASTGETLGTLEDVRSAKKQYCNIRNLNENEVQKLEESFFKFSFVRHPHSRFMSAYMDKILKGDLPVKAKVSRWFGRRIDSLITVDEFLDYLENGGLHADGHWSPQVDWISYPVEKLDYIGRVENLDRDLSVITARIFGESTSLVNVAPHATSKLDIARPELSQRQLERVTKLYEKDFDVLGYTRFP